MVTEDERRVYGIWVSSGRGGWLRTASTDMILHSEYKRVMEGYLGMSKCNPNDDREMEVREFGPDGKPL